MLFRSDACAKAGVPFFFKQWGAWWPVRADIDDWAGAHLPGDIGMFKGRPVTLAEPGPTQRQDQLVTVELPPDRKHRWPDGTWSVRVGKKAAGRLLDGREWNEFPEADDAKNS